MHRCTVKLPRSSSLFADAVYKNIVLSGQEIFVKDPYRVPKSYIAFEPAVLRAIQNNYDIVLNAVQSDGMAIRCASKELRENIDVAFAACNNNLKAFPYIGKNIRKEVELKLNNCIDGFDMIENCMTPESLDYFRSFFDVIENAEE